MIGHIEGMNIKTNVLMSFDPNILMTPLKYFQVKLIHMGMHLPLLAYYIKLSFFNKNSNIGQRESKIENPTKSPNEPPIDPNIPMPS